MEKLRELTENLGNMVTVIRVPCIYICTWRRFNDYRKYNLKEIFKRINE